MKYSHYILKIIGLVLIWYAIRVMGTNEYWWAIAVVGVLFLGLRNILNMKN